VGPHSALRPHVAERGLSRGLHGVLGGTGFKQSDTQLQSALELRAHGSVKLAVWFAVQALKGLTEDLDDLLSRFRRFVIHDNGPISGVVISECNGLSCSDVTRLTRRVAGTLQKVEAVEDVGEALVCGGESDGDGVGGKLKQACGFRVTESVAVAAGRARFLGGAIWHGRKYRTGHGVADGTAQGSDVFSGRRHLLIEEQLTSRPQYVRILQAKTALGSHFSVLRKNFPSMRFLGGNLGVTAAEVEIA